MPLDRTARFTLALAVAVATPVAILFFFQFRSLADLEQAYSLVLQQRSRQAATTLHERLVDELHERPITETGADRFRGEFLPRVVREALAAPGIPGRLPTVEAAVLDDAGHVIFQSAPFNPDAYVDERQVSFGRVDKPERWRIRTGYGDQTIPAIAQASTGRQRNIMIVLVLLMSGGVFFVARAAGRELRLAEMKSSFVASVSHDLKTPLALIQLFAETLELGRVKSSERVQEYYRIINDEARKLTRSINNLLDFSRIDAGLRQYRRVPADLGELVRTVVRSLDSQFQQGLFRVVTDVPPSVFPVLVDPEAVRQALENLLSNAMKYSPDDRHITVRLRRVKDAVELQVVDRGIGIAPRHHRRIFRKFYRIEPNPPLGAPGTGLGLAIVDDIMRGHRGSIRVESEPGRGSTFSLRFPIDREAGLDAANLGDRGRAADAARTA